MRDVDKEWILEKFASAQPYLNLVHELIDVPKEEYISDFKLNVQAERVFEVLSQVMLDICSHVVACLDLGVPATYSDCLFKLAENGIIPDDDLNALVPLIRMRNLIVHQYGRIDRGIVHDSLIDLVKDFSKYKTAILEWMEK